MILERLCPVPGLAKGALEALDHILACGPLSPRYGLCFNLDAQVLEAWGGVSPAWADGLVRGCQRTGRSIPATEATRCRTPP